MDRAEQIIVQTRSGLVEGSHHSGLSIFKGIPYAAPPVGKLRWLPPQPVTPWQNVRRTQAFGPIAPQNPIPASPIPALTIEGDQDEDCLFLNIWSPGLDTAKRPVMVWIHGGAFILGAGSQAIFDGTRLAKHGDVVIVTINYRLGALGFMNLHEVTQGRIPATGNEGLLDQVAALEWVRDNIAAFGGDPGNVTVFGESAGAMSIGCLLAMPVAQGKFHKAILQSGSGNTVAEKANAARIAGLFLETLHLQAIDEDALRALTVQQLMAAQQTLGLELMAAEHRITPFQPVVDGVIIPELPIEALRKGTARQIKVLAGTNRDEWKLFAMMEPGFQELDEAGLGRRLAAILPSADMTPLITAYRDSRGHSDQPTTPAELLTAIQTDLMFRMPSIQLVEAQTQQHQAAYSYLFTWKSPMFGGILGACHALEIGFVFGRYGDSFCGSGPPADRLCRAIQDAWVSFAHCGDPSCESIGVWTPYGDNRATMLLDQPCRLETAPYETERRAWDRFSIAFSKPI